MASNNPQGPRPSATDESELTVETLKRLEQRLDRASEAAERLLAEAAAAALNQGPPPDPARRRPPPAGWQTPDPEPEDAGRANRRIESDLLVAAIQTLRDRIPPELQRRLAEALREVLVAVRALIDWYLERTERRHREPPEVQDIPIL